MGTPLWLDRHLTVAATAYSREPTGAKDEYNNDIYEDVPHATRCFIQPVSQDEIQDGRALVGQYMAHLPAEAAQFMSGFSRLQVGTQSYEVVGPPAIYPSLLRPDQIHHVEVTVVRSTA